jgi:hypothetical protein
MYVYIVQTEIHLPFLERKDPLQIHEQNHLCTQVQCILILLLSLLIYLVVLLLYSIGEGCPVVILVFRLHPETYAKLGNNIG